MSTNTVTQQEMEAAERRALQARLSKSLRRFLIYGGMSFLVFVFLFPIIFMVVAAFKPNDRVIADLSGIQAFLPDLSTLTMDNINDVFDRVPFARYGFNSLFITFVTVSVGLFVNSMAAYVLSRLRWFGRAAVLSIIISLIIIPLEAIAVPLMMQVNQISLILNVILTLLLTGLMVLLWSILWDVLQQRIPNMTILEGQPDVVAKAIQAVLVLIISLPIEILVFLLAEQTIVSGADGGSWLNTYHVQILPFLAEPFSIFLFYQFFIGIPKDFDEAAVVDGAGYFRIYWQIIVPISRPVFATVAILKFLQFWSFYLWPLMVIREQDMYPLMVGMDFFQTQQPIKWGSIMAYAAMVTIPVLITFLLFQKWFVQSVSSSGVKG